MVRILLIDDEELALFTIGEILSDEGHVVVTATNGAAGLALYDSDQFDLVITDMVMPNREGTQTIDDIRKRSAAVPIIGMSGGSRVHNVDIREMALRCGANTFLAKPFSADDLREAIAATCPESGITGEAASYREMGPRR